MPVEKVLFSQKKISSHFQDGRPLEKLIEQLHRGEVDVMTAPFLILHAIEADGRVYALANRRLACLKEFQKHTHGQVLVRLRVTRASSRVAQFIRQCDGGGVTVRCRGKTFHNV